VRGFGGRIGNCQKCMVRIEDGQLSVGVEDVSWDWKSAGGEYPVGSRATRPRSTYKKVSETLGAYMVILRSRVRVQSPVGRTRRERCYEQRDPHHAK
jgi:hypothetical protein